MYVLASMKIFKKTYTDLIQKSCIFDLTNFCLYENQYTNISLRKGGIL